MLKLLADYAYAYGIETEPGFKSKQVRWAIELDSINGFTGVRELGDTTSNNNNGQDFLKCPDLSQAELVGVKPDATF